MGGLRFHKQTIRDVPLENKVVLMRVDYNVPLTEDGAIDDDFRIQANLPTVNYLLGQHCKVVIIAHLGRPEGRDEKYTLRVVAERLQDFIDVPVTFVDDCIGDKVTVAVKKAPAKSVVVLENLRFYEQEEANDEEFAHKLAKCSGAKYFVQDGFGVVHRAHASTEAITHFLPAVSGLLLEKEFLAIERVIKRPEHPVVTIMGGAKVSDKIPIITAFEKVADTILIGGAMANTILANAGQNMGLSKIELDQGAEIAKIYDIARRKVGDAKVNDYLVLPEDLAVASSPDGERTIVGTSEVAADKMALDIGDKTIDTFVKTITQAKTVIWNGTLGLAEKQAFAHGSARIALALATHPGILSLIGGGDTADFVRHWDSKQGGSFTHVSTGGGASLDLLAGKKLPGIEALLDARAHTW